MGLWRKTGADKQNAGRAEIKEERSLTRNQNLFRVLKNGRGEGRGQGRGEGKGRGGGRGSLNSLSVHRSLKQGSRYASPVR